MKLNHLFAIACLATSPGCADEPAHEHGDPPPVDPSITRLEVHATARSSGDSFTFVWQANEPLAPVPMFLPDSSDHNHHHAERYEVAVRVFSDSVDINSDIHSQGQENQLIFTGGAVNGPATGDQDATLLRHTYRDVDALGDPIGLENRFFTQALGQSSLAITWLTFDEDHPKTPTVADDIATLGVDAFSERIRLQANFNVEIE